MRALFVLAALLAASAPASAQPGRWAPPRFNPGPIGGGGGGWRGPSLLPIGAPVGAGLGVLAALAAGVGVVWLISSLWGKPQGPPPALLRAGAAGGEASAPRPDAPAMPVDRIHSAETAEALSVAVRQEMVARGGDWGPCAVRRWLEDAFHRVHAAWEARDYSGVRDLLGDALRERHGAMLREMRAAGEINRCEGLSLERMEFVELRGEDGLVALLTFSGAFFYVDERGEYTRGDRRRARFQEAWILRMIDGRWTVQANVPSDEYRLPAPPPGEDRAENVAAVGGVQE